MSQCVGLLGRLFGHKYAARHSEASERVGVEAVLPSSAWANIRTENTEAPRKSESRTYHGDVCERCGAVVNAQPPAPPQNPSYRKRRKAP